MPIRKPTLLHERVAAWMIAVTLCGIVASVATGRWIFAAGFGVGAAVAILNFLWLNHAAFAILDAQEKKVSVVVVVKFCARFPLVIAAVYMCGRTGWLPPLALLAGLCVGIGGLFAEVLFQLFEGGRQSEATF
ncbi:MAG: ATP synthase subunit I [Terriglobia bacterium]